MKAGHTHWQANLVVEFFFHVVREGADSRSRKFHLETRISSSLWYMSLKIDREDGCQAMRLNRIHLANSKPSLIKHN